MPYNKDLECKYSSTCQRLPQRCQLLSEIQTVIPQLANMPTPDKEMRKWSLEGAYSQCPRRDAVINNLPSILKLI